MVGGAGSWGWVEILITVIFGVIYCFLLAELAAMYPEKVGGLPTYAVEGFRDKKWGNLLGGFNNWAYFLGWSPVISVNCSLLAVYTASLGGFTGTFYNGVNAIWPVGYEYIFGYTLGICLLLYLINYFGLALGYRAAVIFAIISLGPLLFLGFAPIVSGAMNWGQIFPLNSGLVTAPVFSMAWILAIYPWFFIATWNALAMEATASYLGECKNPASDAPKAMTAAAITGLAIYTSIPFAMLGVSGSAAVAADPWGGFIGIASLYAGPYATDIIGVMLYAALLLSTTNALIGCARSLYQSSIEGLTLSWFGKLNKHGSPYRSMAFGVVFNLILVMIVAGLPTLIYVVSNVGYLFSFIPTGIAYFRLKRGYKGMPQRNRPYSLPGWFNGLAIACVVFFTVIWATAGPLSPYSVYSVASLDIPPIFFWLLGLGILAMGIPMYWAGNKTYQKRLSSGTLTEAEKAQREHLQ